MCSSATNPARPGSPSEAKAASSAAPVSRGATPLHILGLAGAETVVLILMALPLGTALGLLLALGLGYADFEVTPGQTYKVYVGSATGAPLVTLPVGPCPLARDERVSSEEGWASYHLHVIRLGSASASPTAEPSDAGD